MIKDYVSFDLETTGLSVDNHEIIEIGAVKVKSGKVIDRFTEFIKPNTKISATITNITGITNEMVANARPTDEIIRDFANFCEDYILLGHNIMFDYKFVKKYASNYSIPFEKKGIDTLKIARKVLKQLESKSLTTLCDYYHVVNRSAHRAYHDALATAKIYHLLAHDFETKDENLFCPVQLMYKPKKSQPCTLKQIAFLNALCDYHNLQMNIHTEILSKSDASKMIDKIISEHGQMFQ